MCLSLLSKPISVEVQGAWGEFRESERLRRWGGFINESEMSLGVRVLGMRYECGFLGKTN